MNSFLHFIKVLYKRIWWLVAVPLIVGLVVFFVLSRQPKQYKSETTVYTGIISGYNVSSSTAGSTDWLSVNTSLDNLISIIKAESTLENVFLRLYSRCLSHLDANNDNDFLSAKSSVEILVDVPEDVLRLVVKGDEEATLEKLSAYYNSSRANFLKQLFMWEDPLFSYKALSEITVSRISSSDMIRISYTNKDRNIVYNTIMILIDEFKEQYFSLRYDQTDDVIGYFEDELTRIRSELTEKEDNLMNYNIHNQIINYQEQTKMVAERSRDLDVDIEKVNRELSGARQKREILESKMGSAADMFRENADFVSKLNEISSLYAQAASEGTDTNLQNSRINQETSQLRDISKEIMSSRYSKEGMSMEAMSSEWLTCILEETKAEAELLVLYKGEKENASDIERFSPVGTSLNRQNREIGFMEENYKSNLQAFNEAKLRRRNLQMSSATFKILSPPTVAMSPEKTKNKIYTLIAILFAFFVVASLEILKELFNRKPYDGDVAKKIIGFDTIGAFPLMDGGELDETYSKFASIQLGNAIVSRFDRTKTNNIINVISINSGEGKSLICEQLMAYFKNLDANPVYVSWHKDFDYESKYYLLSGSIYDFAVNEDNMDLLPNADVTIVEYPPLSQSSFPSRLLSDVALNLIVVDVRNDWTGMSDILLNQLVVNNRNSDNTVVCINGADVDAVGAYTGMLPPYSKRHRMRYSMWNLDHKDVS